MTSLTTISNNAFEFQSFGNNINFTNCNSLNTIGEFAFAESDLSGVIDFSGLTNLTNIGERAFISNPKITQYRFFNNFGLQIGIQVDPCFNGQTSSGGTPPISWVGNPGFTIPDNQEYIFTK